MPTAVYLASNFVTTGRRTASHEVSWMQPEAMQVKHSILDTHKYQQHKNQYNLGHIIISCPAGFS